MKTFLIALFLAVLATEVNAQPRTASFQLSWTDNSNNELGFKLYRKTGSTYSSIGQVGANQTVFTTPSFTANEGEQVCFAATAFNEASPGVTQESSKAEGCGTVVTALASIPLVMESKVLPEYRMIEVTLNKPTGASKATLTLEVFDPDFPDEGDLWINGNGPISLFGSIASSAYQQVVGTMVYDIPVSYFVNGVNKFRFGHQQTDGYKINALTVAFETPVVLAPAAPTGLSIK